MPAAHRRGALVAAVLLVLVLVVPAALLGSTDDRVRQVDGLAADAPGAAEAPSTRASGPDADGQSGPDTSAGSERTSASPARTAASPARTAASPARTAASPARTAASPARTDGSSAPPAGPAPDSAVVARGDGELSVVAVPEGSGGDVGTSGPRYLVEVEGGLGVDPDAFAREVDEVLSDPRGWSAGGYGTPVRVDAPPVDFRVALTSPDTTDRLCLPLDTAGIFSCEVGQRATLNARRWLQGADAYGDDVTTYREYLVLHEVGHALGLGHVFGCDEQGRARTMQQQTKTLDGCAPNPWPFPDAAQR